MSKALLDKSLGRFAGRRALVRVKSDVCLTMSNGLRVDEWVHVLQHIVSYHPDSPYVRWSSRSIRAIVGLRRVVIWGASAYEGRN